LTNNHGITAKEIKNETLVLRPKKSPYLPTLDGLGLVHGSQLEDRPKNAGDRGAQQEAPYEGIPWRLGSDVGPFSQESPENILK